MSRTKELEKALKLKVLYESRDYSDLERTNERRLAKERFEKIVEEKSILPVELALVFPVDKEKLNFYLTKYGSYGDYIYFFDVIDDYVKIRPKEPYFNSYLKPYDLNFSPRTDTRHIRLDSRIDIPDKVLREEILKLSKTTVFSDLLRVKRLNLSGKKVKNLKGLEFCKNLKELDLSYSEVTDLSPVESLSSLESVNISGLKTDHVPTILKNLKIKEEK